MGSLNERITEEYHSNQTTTTTNTPPIESAEQKEWLVLAENDVENTGVNGTVQLQDKIKQKGCGLQIVNGIFYYFILSYL